MSISIIIYNTDNILSSIVNRCVILYIFRIIISIIKIDSIYIDNNIISLYYSKIFFLK